MGCPVRWTVVASDGNFSTVVALSAGSQLPPGAEVLAGGGGDGAAVFAWTPRRGTEGGQWPVCFDGYAVAPGPGGAPARVRTLWGADGLPRRCVLLQVRRAAVSSASIHTVAIPPA